MGKAVKPFLIFLVLAGAAIILPPSHQHLLWAQQPSSHYWYEKFRDKTGAPDDPMDRQLFGIKNRSSWLCLVYDQASGKPLPGVRITALGRRNQVLFRAKSGPRGTFVLRPHKHHAFRLRLQMKGYATLERAVATDQLPSPLTFPLIQAHSTTVRNRKDVASIWDHRYRVRLRVPGSVLKRRDGGPLRFPITVSLAYIDPEKDLEAMPGRNMLAHIGGRGEIQPLFSWGAALIEARDAGGARVVLDRSRIRPGGQTTELTFQERLKAARPGNTNAPPPFSGWQIYPGNRLWAPSSSQPQWNVTQMEGGYYRNIKANDVELAPFNLDKPSLAFPMLVVLQRSSGGKYKVSVRSSRREGRYEMHQLFSGKQATSLRLLAPAGEEMRVLIFTRPGQKQPDIVRRLKVPAARQRYRLDKQRRIVTASGNKPKWKKLGTIRF